LVALVYIINAVSLVNVFKIDAYYDREPGIGAQITNDAMRDSPAIANSERRRQVSH
jgi:hypothetical protein